MYAFGSDSLLMAIDANASGVLFGRFRSFCRIVRALSNMPCRLSFALKESTSDLLLCAGECWLVHMSSCCRCRGRAWLVHVAVDPTFVCFLVHISKHDIFFIQTLMLVCKIWKFLNFLSFTQWRRSWVQPRSFAQIHFLPSHFIVISFPRHLQ